MAENHTRPAPPTSDSQTLANTSADSETRAEDLGEAEDAGYIVPSSERELTVLAEAIRDPQRDYPILGLSARPGEHRPALDAASVRAIVGPGVPIYFLRTRQLTRCLSGLLPARFDMWDGATRVWWPGVSETSDPLDHPRIYDPSGRYGQDSLQRLAAEFATQPRPELTMKQQLVLSERQRSQLSERTARLERALAATRRELDLALRGISPAADQTTQDDPVERPDTPSGALGSEDPDEAKPKQPVQNENDIEGTLYKLIWSQWVDICPPHERAQHPPRRFVLHRDLIRTIAQRRVDVPIERVAWVCAMIIGDRAIGHAGIDAHIYRGSEDSERQDGAKAMRAALKRSTGGPRLHYWSLPNGTIEFTQLGYHDLALSSHP
jgi:hypothetical protein